MRANRARRVVCCVAVAIIALAYSRSSVGAKGTTAMSKAHQPKVTANTGQVRLSRDPFIADGARLPEVRKHLAARARPDANFPLPPNLELVPGAMLNAVLPSVDPRPVQSQVLGTIVGPRGRFALIETNGNTAMVREGESFNGLRIVRIKPKRVLTGSGTLEEL
jgi:hypothetical protein